MKAAIHCMLLAAFAVYVAGCSKQTPDPAQLRADETELIRSTVADPARAERLLALLDERDRLVEATAAMVDRYRRELKKLNRDYDASREVAVEMLDYYNRDRAQIQLEFIKLVSAMKRVTTAAEWKLIAKFQLDNFHPRAMTQQPAGGA